MEKLWIIHMYFMILIVSIELEICRECCHLTCVSCGSWWCLSWSLPGGCSPPSLPSPIWSLPKCPRPPPNPNLFITRRVGTLPFSPPIPFVLQLSKILFMEDYLAHPSLAQEMLRLWKLTEAEGGEGLFSKSIIWSLERGRGRKSGRATKTPL